MSYNVDKISIVAHHGFRLPIEYVDALRRDIGDDHPEVWLLEEKPHTPFMGVPDFEDRDSYRYYNRISWTGEGSGGTWETFVEKVLPRFQGSADLVVTWERGDSVTGLRVRDGKVTKHRVVMALGEQYE